MIEQPGKSKNTQEHKDRENTAAKYGKTAQAVEEYDKTAQAMEELMQTVASLRAPDGCPWDRAQTHESLKAACVEEAAEVVSGINILARTGDSRSLCEELGDLLLQVVMHAQIAEEEGLFSMEDVIRGINTKMIRRHPHVFGEESLKYLPPEYVRSLREKAESPESPCEAREGDLKSECPNIHEAIPEALTEAQKGSPASPALLADWKQIKSFEKEGREWEEEYLFRAFDESEELIGVARRRKQEKKEEKKREQKNKEQ